MSAHTPGPREQLAKEAFERGLAAGRAEMQDALDALARAAREADAKLRDSIADAAAQFCEAFARAQSQHAEQYGALRKDLREAVALLEWVQARGVVRLRSDERDPYLAKCEAIDALVERLGGGT